MSHATTDPDRISSHIHQELGWASAPPVVADSRPTTCKTSWTGTTRLRGKTTKLVPGVSTPHGASRPRKESRSTPFWSTASVPVECLIAGGEGHHKGDMPRPTGMRDTPDKEWTNQRLTLSGDDRSASSGRGFKERTLFEPSAGRLDRGRTGTTRLRAGTTKLVPGVSTPHGASRPCRGSWSTPFWRTASVPVELLIAGGESHHKVDMPRPTGMLDTPNKEWANRRLTLPGDDRSASAGRGFKDRTLFEPSAGRLDRGRDRESIQAARKKISSKKPTLLVATSLHAWRDDSRGNILSKQSQEAADNSGITGSVQALTNEVVLLGKGSPPVDGNWAEEIRTRDEQIRVLKQQLASLGGQPVAEMVSLLVSKHPTSVQIPLKSLAASPRQFAVVSLSFAPSCSSSSSSSSNTSNTSSSSSSSSRVDINLTPYNFSLRCVPVGLPRYY